MKSLGSQGIKWAVGPCCARAHNLRLRRVAHPKGGPESGSGGGGGMSAIFALIYVLRRFESFRNMHFPG